MSILVKGMKMPKNCVECLLFESLYHFHGCHAKPESFNDRDMWNFAVGDRPSWCPIVEVPPHGRLIDADALELKADDRYSLHEIGRHELDCIVNALYYAPTVIEADGYSERELQRDYEASVEYAQHCERYEPTYDPETGAM